MSPSHHAALEQGKHREQMRRYCGDDEGLLSPRSSPHLFWLAERLIEGGNRCRR
jgi:hypothetical protein